MRLSTILLAALPALAVADEHSSSAAAPSVTSGTVTTTCTSSYMVTKTLTLSRIHTSVAHNTTTWMPTGSMTMTSTQDAPTTLPTDKGPDSAGVALDAGKVVFAGVAGMIAVALL